MCRVYPHGCQPPPPPPHCGILFRYSNTDSDIPGYPSDIAGYVAIGKRYFPSLRDLWNIF